MSGTLSRLGLQAWIVLFIVFFGAEVVHLEPALRVLTQLLYGLPLAAWALWRLRGPRDALDAGVLVAVLVYASVCLLSRDRTESLGTLAMVVGFSSWFLLMRRVAAGRLRPSILIAAATGLALTLVFNAYLLIQEKVSTLAAFGAAPLEGVTTFPWESVNALPILVLLAIPILAWLEPSRARALGVALIAVCAVVVVPISMGRAGWLGLAVVVVGVSARALRTSVPRRAGLAVGAGAVLIGVIGALAVAPRFVAALGESGRLLLWDQALRMAAASPLTGFGPGTYSWARLDVAPSSADLLAVRLPHSVPLQTLVDGGLVLVISVTCVGLIYALAVARGRARNWADALAALCLVGLAAALTLDDFSYLPAITALGVTIGAFLVPLEDPVAARPGVARWVAPTVLATLAVVSLPSTVTVDSARAAAQEGRTALVAGDYDGAVAAFTRATAAHPENGGYWLGLGMAADSTGQSPLAISSYERATVVSPGDPRGFGGLAALGADGSAAALRAAAQRTLGDPRWSVLLGMELASSGDAEGATDAWSRSVALRPGVLRSLPFEGTGVEMHAVADQALAVLAGGLRPSSVQTVQAQWDILLAIDRLPDDAGPAWRAIEAARSGDLDAAIDLAQVAIDQAPYAALGYQARAAVAAFACDLASEQDALALEARALGAFGLPPAEPSIRREFVYREASLGPTQPLGSGPELSVEQWPWSLVDRPACDS